MTGLSLDSPASALPRVGPQLASRLRLLGIATVADVLLDVPFRTDTFIGAIGIAMAPLDVPVTIRGHVESVRAGRTSRKNIKLTEAIVSDSTGRLKVGWLNQPNIARRLSAGDEVVLAGKVQQTAFAPFRQMTNPRLDVPGRGPSTLDAPQPIYHLTAGIAQVQRRRLAEAALPLADGLPELLDDKVRERHSLLSIADAVRMAHAPARVADFEAAQRRFRFQRLYEWSAATIHSRRAYSAERATPLPYRQEVIEAFKAGLPFELTLAQRRSAWEIFQDLQREVPMNRLLNGDVGAGKTAVAAAAVAMAHAAGVQSVVMAPTEILARQHLEKFRTYLEASFPGLTVELLVAGQTAAERRRVRTAAASGHCALLVGTHALIEDDVQLFDLGLAIVDEQHRFGTGQRERLRAKSRGRPHFLAMTATPIPRTLSLVLAADLAVSMLDELPPGRTPVATRVVAPGDREEAYELVRREVAAGRQAFVICPLVEESETLDAKAATVEHERLSTEVFPDLAVGLVHGRMKDKDAVMERFRAGELQVLVATAVIEVGVDVPNATVMLIEGAERFGLAQLHQFRGRVGRGVHGSHCLLLSDDPSRAALERLRLLEREHDGFRLAEADLVNRGAGEVIGVRQHGHAIELLDAAEYPQEHAAARAEAEAALAADPTLAGSPLLRAAVERRLRQTSIS